MKKVLLSFALFCVTTLRAAVYFNEIANQIYAGMSEQELLSICGNNYITQEDEDIKTFIYSMLAAKDSTRYKYDFVLKDHALISVFREKRKKEPTVEIELRFAQEYRRHLDSIAKVKYNRLLADEVILTKNQIPGAGVRYYANDKQGNVIHVAVNFGNYGMECIENQGVISIRVGQTINNYDRFYTGVTLGKEQKECLDKLDALINHLTNTNQTIIMDETYGVVAIWGAKIFGHWMLKALCSNNSAQSYFYEENLREIRNALVNYFNNQ